VPADNRAGLAGAEPGNPQGGTNHLSLSGGGNQVLAVLGLITTGLAARVYHPCLQRAPGFRIPDPDHRQSAFHHFIMAFRRLTLESFAVIFLIAETSVRCANAATGEIRGE
jgi:hypothetical protein